MQKKDGRNRSASAQATIRETTSRSCASAGETPIVKKTGQPFFFEYDFGNK